MAVVFSVEIMMLIVVVVIIITTWLLFHAICIAGLVRLCIIYFFFLNILNICKG